MPCNLIELEPANQICIISRWLWCWSTNIFLHSTQQIGVSIPNSQYISSVENLVGFKRQMTFYFRLEAFCILSAMPPWGLSCIAHIKNWYWMLMRINVSSEITNKLSKHWNVATPTLTGDNFYSPLNGEPLMLYNRDVQTVARGPFSGLGMLDFKSRI